jgi:DNA helicase HerA-like ATPase
MALPNDSPELVGRLFDDYRATPRGVAEVVVLVPQDLVEERVNDFPGLEVLPLVLAPDELSLNDWRLLMGVEGGDQLYVKAMSNVFRTLRGKLTLRSLRRAVESSRLTPAQKDLAATRIEFVESFVSDGAGVGRHIRAGRLLLVDVRDPWIEEENALALFMVMLRLASQATGQRGETFNKLIVFDEAHKYISNPRLTKAIVETVREMRHKGTTVVLASQNPPSIPKEIIELSSVIVSHKFTSPQWLEHIKKVNAAFGKDLTPARLATLKPGEAFVWSSGPTEELKRPQRVTMRPRLSRHGGATRRAGGE